MKFAFVSILTADSTYLDWQDIRMREFSIDLFINLIQIIVCHPLANWYFFIPRFIFVSFL